MATANMQQGQAMQLLAPDIAQEQNQLMRRQQIADLLRKQSLDPSGGTETIGGWAIKKSPFEALGKMAQALSANYVQDQTDTRQLELAKALQGRMGDAFDKMAGGAIGSGGMSQPQMEGRTDPEAMGPQAGVPAPNAVPESPVMLRMKDQAKAAYMFGNNELSNKLIENYSMMTDAAKRDRELGITAPESKASELAKRLKESTMSFQPGQTNQLPDGTKVVAPNFDTGVAGGFDAQGNPVAREIPQVATIAANRAGGIKEAEAGVADRFALPSKVDAVNGPVAQTPAQQRAAAHGGIDPAYPSTTPAPSVFQPPKPAATTRSKNPMAPQPGDSDQTMIFQTEMRDAQGRLAAAKTPEEKIRAQTDIAGLGREAGRIGIKLQDDSSRKFSEQVASKSADSLLEGRDKAKAASDSLIGIEKSRAVIAGGIFQGTGANTKLEIAKFLNANVPGFNIAPDKVANTDFAKSSLGAALLAEAKTLGTNPSNADANRINDIVGTVGKDPAAMKMILDWRQEMAERSIKNHNLTVTDAEKRGMSSPYELRVTAPSAAPAAAAQATPASKNFASLPNPAEFSGKRMRAPDGSVIRSNGKTWVKE